MLNSTNLRLVLGFFKNIFNKERVLEPISLLTLGADMHSHLIAGVDDGAETIRDSINLIKELRKFGLRHLITTPHIMSDLYLNKKSDLERRAEILRIEIEKEKLDVTLQVSAEYFLDSHFTDLIKKKELMPFGNNHILFEMSFMEKSPLLQECIFEFQSAGYKPILAHPERYGYMHQNLEKYVSLHEQGVSLQLNINSVTGHYGPFVKKASEELIERNVISFLGTDCHHPGHIELMKSAVKSPLVHKLVNSGFLKNASLLTN